MKFINVRFSHKVELSYYLTILLLLISLIVGNKSYYFIFIIIYMMQNSFIDVSISKQKNEKKINNILWILNLSSLLIGLLSPSVFCSFEVVFYSQYNCDDP